MIPWGGDFSYSMNELPKIVAGLMAIAALGASLMNGIDPIQCMLRGGIAWIVGMIAGTVWNLFFTRSPQVKPTLTQVVTAPPPEEGGELESKEAA